MRFPTTIVVPTYWGRPHGSAPQPGDATFDHPTPLDGESTLPRLLDSLARQSSTSDFSIVVLVSAVAKMLESPAATRVRGLLDPYREQLDLIQVDFRAAALLRSWLTASGFDPKIAAFRNYASVRNLQLMVPAILGAEIIVALDDDEVVAPDFMKTAVEWAGREHQGQRVLGLTGAYEDETGDIFLPEPEPTGNSFADKASAMNAAYRQLERTPGRLLPAPLALGGNMVFHRDLFTRVGFDPGITRGEDIDYLINARLAGELFYYDKALRITHLPPRHYETPAYAKLRQDVVRFVYEREKLRAGQLQALDFDPYPGTLLKDGIDQHALEALRLTATPKTAAHYGSPEEILEHAHSHAAESVPAYFEFARQWPQMMGALAAQEDLREGLLALHARPGPG